MRNEFFRLAYILAVPALGFATTFAFAASSFAEDPEVARTLKWSFEATEAIAKAAAQQPYKPSEPLPANLKGLQYDDYRLIAFEPECAIGKQQNEPFQLELFHRGYLFHDAVRLHLVSPDRIEDIPFDRTWFQYRGRLANLEVPADAGFAGFRILGKFHSSKNFLELASFLGASYFRCIAEGQVYGTSARGLAIDVGLPKTEEFPVFREFWIAQPPRGSDALQFWALLDSPSVAGAYEFTLRPGSVTQCDVVAKLFFRRRVEKVGIAPLTSMWAWGADSAPPKNEPRPQVHDADGLLIWTTDDEWIWRPLGKQTFPSLSHYDFAGIRGFGLLQRERRQEQYLDDEAKYHLRPSVWIEPKIPWPAGAVELLELPAEHEGIDDIAAWWTPAAPLRIAEPLELRYRVLFSRSEPRRPNVARTVATRVVRDAGQPIRIEVDFVGEFSTGSYDAAPISPEVKSQRGSVRNVVCTSPRSNLLQLAFEVFPTASDPVELTAVVNRNGKPLTESWRYLCRP